MAQVAKKSSIRFESRNGRSHLNVENVSQRRYEISKSLKMNDGTASAWNVILISSKTAFGTRSLCKCLQTRYSLPGVTDNLIRHGLVHDNYTQTQSTLLIWLITLSW